MKRIAILTGGGDAPGLSTVIMSAVRTAIMSLAADLGIRTAMTAF
jgi:6-phosphofructokinase